MCYSCYYCYSLFFSILPAYRLCVLGKRGIKSLWHVSFFPSKHMSQHNTSVLIRLALCRPETPKWILWQTVKTQVKCISSGSALFAKEYMYIKI